jgi:pyroglutamyl-peptidase
MRCIITGFEAQYGIKRTPSGELAELWQSGALEVPGIEVKSLVLPQLFSAHEILCTEIAAYKPHIVLMSGATQKNDPVRMERFAVNIIDSTMGDNSKIPTRDSKIVLNGPAAYESSLPCKFLADELTKIGVSAVASYHAGTHTCNCILYNVMHWLTNNNIGHPVAAGFTHYSFPDSFGVVEDRHWGTEDFQGVVNASLKLVELASKWYILTHKMT